MSKQFEQMTVAELREYAETVQAEFDADEISGANGRQIVRDAWARVEEAIQAEELATLPQSTINVAVSSIASAVELGHISAARQTADHIGAKITKCGGKIWVKSYWFGSGATVDVPTGYMSKRYQLLWPVATRGEIVEYDGKLYTVVANFTAPTNKFSSQFGFYAIMPV